MSVGMLELDQAAPSQLVWKGQRFRLTAQEFRLVHCLALCAMRVVDHHVLYRVVYGEDIVEPAQVGWHISRLRRRTAAAVGWPLPITNFPGRGYALMLDARHISMLDSRGENGDESSEKKTEGSTGL